MFIRLPHTIQLRLEFRAIALELFGEFLGQGKCLDRIVALSFRTVETFL
jgi:hypothetical protein